MSEVSLKDVKAGFSAFVDQAAAGEFVTITRHGKPAAVIVSLEAAEVARNALAGNRPGLVRFLRDFATEVAVDDETFARNRAPGREFDW